MTDIEPTEALLQRHDRPTPRYTSYPTADRFASSFGPADYIAALRRADEDAHAPFALYFHVPFCRRMCAYCGCAVVATASAEALHAYLDRLLLEVDRVLEHLPQRRRVTAIHLGGGTPNLYAPDDLARILAYVEEHFHVEPDAEVAIEVDPREATAEDIAELHDVGFKRISFGVQDTDADVQVAIGRVQPLTRTQLVVDAARRHGFAGINVDLIYGLPRQTRVTFARTVDEVIRLRPDRVALFSFAYIPEVKRHQLKIVRDDLPVPSEKLAIFCDARRALLAAGYVAIGMDHFARPDDALARASAAGSLTRTFQGYEAGYATESVGFGMSAIGEVGGAYVQNGKNLRDYNAAIDAGRLPVARGIALSRDDLLRRTAIRALMCRERVTDDDDLRVLGATLASDLGDALVRLRPLEQEGLVRIGRGVVEVTPLGRLFVRSVAAAFDSYLATNQTQGPYSRAV